VLHPDSQLILDSKVDFFALNTFLFRDSNGTGRFKNLLGIDLDLFENFNSSHQWLSFDFSIENSIFEFYHENRPLTLCDQNLTSLSKNPIFSLLNSLDLGSNVKYSTRIRPFVFQNANLSTLVIA
jgi:hypothetical protein